MADKNVCSTDRVPRMKWNVVAQNGCCEYDGRKRNCRSIVHAAAGGDHPQDGHHDARRHADESGGVDECAFKITPQIALQITTNARRSREGGNPLPFARTARGSRLRGNDVRSCGCRGRCLFMPVCVPSRCRTIIRQKTAAKRPTDTHR